LLARALLQRAYAAMARVGAIDQRDADGLRDLGVPPSALLVTGDSRHDAVAARAATDDPTRKRLRTMLAPDLAPLIVAGSTWPGDEAALVPALATLRAGRAWRLVVAPHEPAPRALTRLERALDAALHPVVIRRLSDLEREASRGDAPGTVAWDVCVVDRVGVLFDLYGAAAVAYVGGGFHAAGLHSVIEPAAFGVPVVVGPRWESSRDARLLLEAGGAATVSTSDALARALRAWLDDTTARAAAGAAARAVVDRGLGAAARSAALVIELAERASATAS
jgi:3-deoxy-D-manno-octulosonic-acid transferase